LRGSLIFIIKVANYEPRIGCSVDDDRPITAKGPLRPAAAVSNAPGASEGHEPDEPVFYQRAHLAGGKYASGAVGGEQAVRGKDPHAWLTRFSVSRRKLACFLLRHSARPGWQLGQLPSEDVAQNV
jgi:hypothetical protein